MSNRVLLKKLRDEQMLGNLDYAFGQMLIELGATEVGAIVGAWVSRQLQQQQTCIDLEFLGQPFLPHFRIPHNLRALLADEQVVEMVELGKEQYHSPLVLDGHLLYLHRYWQHESMLAAALKRLSAATTDLPQSRLKDAIESAFRESSDDVDWQKVAVCLASLKPFCLITGGPGTGKTTTVARLLAVLQTVYQGQLNIKLAAPTGKAAARLSESISTAKSRLNPQVQEFIPSECHTLHRLLGNRGKSTEFLHDKSNPLHLDMLVVDEASMIDLAMMRRLVDALPEGARLVLLGDQQQLASVEVGCVLADICAPPELENRFSLRVTEQLSGMASTDLLPALAQSQVLTDNRVTLQKSHRFNQHSGIGQLAKAINLGRIEESLECFKCYSSELECWNVDAQQDVIDWRLDGLKRYLAHLKRFELGEAFHAATSQMLLSVTRKGRWGVDTLNELIELAMYRKGWISATSGMYAGRLLMVTENDHQLGVFNGDIAMVMDSPEQPGLLKAWFPLGDGQFKGVLLGRLPAVQSLYAMTVHKSQGSEYDDVMLCLPDDKEIGLHRGLCKEVVYTAVTRSKKRFLMNGSTELFSHCLTQHSARASGLSIRLS